MAWKLECAYFENCNCDWVCVCSVTSLVAPATPDRITKPPSSRIGTFGMEFRNEGKSACSAPLAWQA